MKQNKILRIVTSLMALFLFMLMVSATPVLAQDGSISVSPSRGEVGDEIDIEGDGFDPGDRVYFFFSNCKAKDGKDISRECDAYEELGSDRASSSGTTYEGEFEKSVDVPDELSDGDKDETVHFGTYYVYASYDSDGDDIVDSDEFSVTGFELDITQGNVGGEVEITGGGFSSRDDIEVFYDGDEIDIESGDTETDRDGEFTSIIIIPASTAGDHDVQVEIDRDEAEVEFTVVPAVTFTPASGNAGDQITVSGNGFGGNKDLTVYFSDTPVTLTSGAVSSDSNGSFDNFTFKVPPQGAGTYDIRVWDSADNSATAKTKFTISGTVDMSPTSGNVGTMITASGIGFAPGSAVTIKYDDKQRTTTTVQSGGAFSTEFAAPASKSGAHAVTVSGTMTKQFTFTMESTSPPMPALLMPADGSESKPEVYFDWQDVTDPSLPVTYVLQVGSNRSFASVVLMKEGLPASEYTLATESDKLAAVKKENPYYWRVKGVDSASNESDWSTPRSFYILEPPAPELLLPGADSKAKAQAQFDWDDVTSLSLPITYNLQVSADDDFSSISLQKKGLSDSEYTLTEDEQLPAVKKEAPYYWRVKAVDSAGNESEWSNPRPFYVGSVFELTGWILYTLVAIGGLILLFIVFRLGRRTPLS
ncbi:IPT/TIG domain-containing protein [Chloroflexota bacterium]